MTGFIEWDVPQPAVRERLLACPIIARGEVIEHDLVRIRTAKLEDLRKACEAVGLHVVEKANEADGLNATVDGLTHTLTLIRLALDPLGDANDADVFRLAGYVSTRRVSAENEVATLRAQLAASEARITKAEQETEVSLDGLTNSYVSGCAALGVDRGSLLRGIDAAKERAETAEAKLAALTPTEGRATDEELATAADISLDRFATRRALYELGIVHGRRERPACLVERLVAAKVDVQLWQSYLVGYWKVSVTPKGKPVNQLEECHHLGVPATLARLAGLDGGR